MDLHPYNTKCHDTKCYNKLEHDEECEMKMDI
jgi:hypothetical protein